MTQTERFDREAATWDDNPRRGRMAQEVAKAIAARVPLSAGTKALDFGCGTGLLTLQLWPLVGSITGVDTSPGMLDVLARKVAALGLTGVETRLLPPDGGHALEGAFDLIVSCMALHHVQDLDPLFRRFHEHLAPGGRIALADLDMEDGSFHGDVADVHHLGFDRARLKGMLAAAGFTELEDTTAYEMRRNGRDYPVFLITGRKA
ncbi:MAG TPA: class I SAM-dependent methyltransferase [Holophaga sp.]|nr:class I SAM-dependent methyltransferase [Holophaga sp.]